MKLLAALVLVAAVTGCVTPPGPFELVSCPRADVPNAAYVGPYYGVENVIPVHALAQDLRCAEAFKAERFPQGFVTLYGSSRIKAGDPLYQDVKAFGSAWTQRYGKQFPIMSGAGPGLMEAVNQGALEAGGPSIGYTTYYDRDPNGTPERPYGGNPRVQLNRYVSQGLIFSSVATREQAMIKHSAAIVIAPGGTGTEWEIFQILEMMKSGQLAKVPVYFLGSRDKYWRAFDARLDDMAQRGTAGANELAFRQHVDSGDELLRRLAADLKL
ncbi:LOG family protein [Ramlibacter sp. G-1-2-2]|uniref:AMP nucleosidase n=1 Tax=Ramlibacter agri TaxID=2728837 RepID=A0A848H9J4_9BURK|nr:LOG family protein [Ramlibacter agri]NML44308.1 LOG family protein [Ramlibacter agri]